MIKFNIQYFFIISLLITPEIAWCYRPFDSTDADVVEQGEIEIELGLFNWAHARNENTYVTPQLVFNYGITDEIEFVAEFEAEHMDGDTNITDPGIFIKRLLRRGVLQETGGLSLAVEAGLLLPSTLDEEDSIGFEAIGIISGELAPFTYHINFGGGVDRVNGNAFGLWGVILEYPLDLNTRLVAELNGEYPENEAAEHSGLVGVIWEPPSYPDTAVDLSLRHGIDNTEPDWSLSIGMTFNF